MTLSTYFSSRFFLHFLWVFLTISLLIYLLDFFEILGSLKTEDAVYSALGLGLLRAPSFITEAIPLIVLLSSISFSISLARSNEFVISRAAGRSALSSMFLPAICALLIGVVFVLALEPFAGRLKTKFDTDYASLRATETHNISVSDTGYWMRQDRHNGHEFIHAKSITDNGKIMRNTEVLFFNATDEFTKRIYSKTAFLNPNEIIFINATEWNMELLSESPREAKRTVSYFRLETDITANQILEGYTKPEELSPLQIGSEIEKIKRSGFNTLKYETQRMSQIARPFFFAAMLLLGAVFTLQNARLGNLGYSILAALICGFLLHSLQNFSMTLGSSGEIPLVIAIWGPTLASMFLTLALFLHQEDG